MSDHDCTMALRQDDRAKICSRRPTLVLLGSFLGNNRNFPGSKWKKEDKSTFTRGVFIALNDISIPARHAITRSKAPSFFVMKGLEKSSFGLSSRGSDACRAADNGERRIDRGGFRAGAIRAERRTDLRLPPSFHKAARACRRRIWRNPHPRRHCASLPDLVPGRTARRYRIH